MIDLSKAYSIVALIFEYLWQLGPVESPCFPDLKKKRSFHHWLELEKICIRKEVMVNPTGHEKGMWCLFTHLRRRRSRSPLQWLNFRMSVRQYYNYMAPLQQEMKRWYSCTLVSKINLEYFFKVIAYVYHSLSVRCRSWYSGKILLTLDSWEDCNDNLRRYTYDRSYDGLHFNKRFEYLLNLHKPLSSTYAYFWKSERTCEWSPRALSATVYDICCHSALIYLVERTLT